MGKTVSHQAERTLVPFAVRLLSDEKTDLLFVDPSEGDGDPTPDAVMDTLYEIVTEMRQRGAAIVSVVDTSNGDVVRIELERGDGGPALALLLRFTPAAGSGYRSSSADSKGSRRTSDLGLVDPPPSAILRPPFAR